VERADAVQQRLPAADALQLSDAGQWARARSEVAMAWERAGNARRCHAAAAEQLDAASYALQSLLDDLAPLMKVADRAAAGAVVRRIEPSPARRSRTGEALAA
jgi:hypothetical protein